MKKPKTNNFVMDDKHESLDFLLFHPKTHLPSSLICSYFFLAMYFLHAFWMVLANVSNFLSRISSSKNSYGSKKWGLEQEMLLKDKVYYTIKLVRDFLDWTGDLRILELVSGLWSSPTLDSWWRLYCGPFDTDLCPCSQIARGAIHPAVLHPANVATSLQLGWRT